MTNTILVQHVSKRFRRYDPERPQTLQEAIVRGLRRLRPLEHFWALQDVSFAVPAGCTVGLIGRNGAGKSTLLRLIGGVGRPERGQIHTAGRIGALLDLGAGFHPDLTGRENVFISGVIAGLTRQQVAQRFEAIVEFAELEAFIDNPLRTYSTGMQMRLGFAVAIHIEPDILLIDEVLAVGDIAFQRKCLDRIADFKARGCTIVFVSHDATLVEQLCDEVVWLRRGQIVAQGAAPVVVGQYVAEMTAETERLTPAEHPTRITASGEELTVHENRFGSLEMEITKVELLGPNGVTSGIDSGDPLQVRIHYQAPQPIPQPIFGVTISDETDTICYETSTAAANVPMPVLQGSGQITLQLERLDLAGGLYYCDVGIYESNWTHAYDYHWHVYTVTVREKSKQKGLLRPPHRWILE